MILSAFVGFTIGFAMFFLEPFILPQQNVWVPETVLLLLRAFVKGSLRFVTFCFLHFP